MEFFIIKIRTCLSLTMNLAKKEQSFIHLGEHVMIERNKYTSK